MTLLSASFLISSPEETVTSMIFPTSRIVSSSSSSSSVTQCQSSSSRGNNGDDGNDDGIFSKAKNILTSVSGGDDDAKSDWNGKLDQLGRELGSKIQEGMDTGLPTQISYGFICGFTSGYCLKKIGRIVSVAFGLGFITLQTLSYSGYVTVNHNKLKEGVEKIMDLNGDGKVDSEDMNKGFDKILEVLNFNMPGGGGFVAGFLGGLRSR